MAVTSESLRPALDLTVRDLWIDIGSGDDTVHAVRGVEFGIGSGRRLGIVGESGSGKTITASAILRILPSQAKVLRGAIDLGGRDLLTLDEREMEGVRGKLISIVFQNAKSALNPVFSIGDQIATVYRRHTHVGRAAAWSHAVEMLGRMGIPRPADRAHAFPHELSGGMAQRVMIAMALICEPAVLIADEPTTGLDLTIQAQVLQVMDGVLTTRDTALVLISHDIGVVRALCDEVVVMYAGEVVESGDMGTVFSAPSHPYTRGLIESYETTDRPAYIPGRVPSLRRTFAGCSFADRCPLADDYCLGNRPTIRALDKGVRVACHKA